MSAVAMFATRKLKVDFEKWQGFEIIRGFFIRSSEMLFVRRELARDIFESRRFCSCSGFACFVAVPTVPSVAKESGRLGGRTLGPRQPVGTFGRLLLKLRCVQKFWSGYEIW